MLNRRQLLSLAAACAGSAALPVAAGASSAERITGLLSDPVAARALGQRCAQRLPASTAALESLAGLRNSASTTDALVQQFAAKRADDFREGRIHRVDGWLMAEAECALCVLLTKV